ncbi:hypothetical protein [Lentzea sp. NBRC 105346]|uniref:hypothetical protein n=1 Tax=Lentzea sp. NBRC 105346 TaxID=3032205 RepID=UPI0025571291|nr:hypothetical protein [Lentzea sp. NBRC 105346]
MTRLSKGLLAAGLLTLVTALPATAAQDDPVLCLRGHVAGTGWQDWTCTSGAGWASAGAENAALDGVEVRATGTGGRTCLTTQADAKGPESAVCVADGEVGKAGGVEKIASVGIGNTARRTCAEGFVTDSGWRSAPCAEPGFTVQIVAGAYKKLSAVNAKMS